MQRDADCFRRWAGCWVGCLTLALLLVGSRSGRAQDTTAVKPHQRRLEVVDTTRLRQIEQRVLPPLVVPGPAAHTDLADYYFAANPSLLERLRQARDAHDRRPPAPYRALTLISGTAGVGKTFIKGQIFRKDCPAESVCKFDIHKLYAQWQAEGKTELRPDLHDGELVLSSLLAARSHKVPLVGDYVASSSASFYVIDSLDEIHPDDYVWVLDQLEDFAFTSSRPYVHVVVLGRPPAFRDYWLGRRTDPSRDVKLCLLEPPHLRTTGDLMVSGWNHFDWKHQLNWRPDGGEPAPMPVEAFAEWSAQGFPRTGRFASVALQGDLKEVTRGHQLLGAWAGEHRMVAGVLPNLAGNGLMREIAQQFASQDRHFDERAVMEAYLHAWLRRDTLSEDRPSLEKPEHLELYLQLLERVAVNGLRQNEVDEQGFYPVARDDRITMSYRGRQVTFPVDRILDRSGMKYLDPRQSGIARYRFEPLWFHRLLVDMHNDNVDAAASSQAARSP